MMINHITFYIDQKKLTLKELQKTNQSIINIIGEIKDDIIKIFSRVDTKTKCNFCPKISYYLDNDNKYYCWYHRSKFE